MAYIQLDDGGYNLTCPKCKQTKTFYIDAICSFEVSWDGNPENQPYTEINTDEPGMNRRSVCLCGECYHEGTVTLFDEASREAAA